jgi:hypothetical protein
MIPSFSRAYAQGVSLPPSAGSELLAYHYIARPLILVLAGGW